MGADAHSSATRAACRRRWAARLASAREDASRADPDFLSRQLETAQAAGASRFRFADTLGVLDPFATAQHIRQCAR
jgi:homocitrate synthase NifV